MMAGAYQGDLDPSASCPKGLDKAFCNTPGLLQPGYTTNLLDSSFTKHYQTDTRLYNWIAKFNFQLNQNNSLVLQYIGSPQTSNGPGTFGGFNGADTTILGSTFENVHDASLHFVSKLADRRLQLDIVAGYHYDEQTNTPGPGGEAQGAFYQPVHSLADFEPGVAPCATQMVHGTTFNPCPVQNYGVGGVGFLDHKLSQRISAAASATYFARLGGTHALKLGFDFEDNIFSHKRNYTGGAFYRVNTDGSIEIYREYAEKSADSNTNPNGPGIALPDTGFNSTEKTLNYGAYLRDSYNVGFIPGLTVNAGVRWEAQQVQGADGSTQIGIYDNWAPRIGAIYDFTRKGRGKLFASYGWFYESIPMDINDRSFSGEGAILAATLGAAPVRRTCRASTTSERASRRR